MDGSRFVPFVGAPDEITSTSPIDASRDEVWSSSPVSLFRPFGFACGTNSGRVFIYDSRDSFSMAVPAFENEPIAQLIADSAGMVAIGRNGGVAALSSEGQLRWKSRLASSPVANAVLVSGSLIVATDSLLTAVDRTSGAVAWQQPSPLSPKSLAGLEDGRLFMAVSHQAASASDSLMVFDGKGTRLFSYGFAVTRITSNIAVLDDGGSVAFGSLGELGENGYRAYVSLYDLKDGTAAERWKFEVPYIVAHVGANDDLIVAGGYRTGMGELVSGMDAFSRAEKKQYWQRRFTEPVLGPMAVGEEDIYFTLSFESDAMIDARGLFYTLSASDGKTFSERPVKASANGFVPGIPMPDERGRFLIADRQKLLIHILDRSSFRRLF